jgi:hypothetical protein
MNKILELQEFLTPAQLKVYSDEAEQNRKRKSDSLQNILIKLFGELVKIGKSSTPNSVMWLVFQSLATTDIKEEQLRLLAQSCFTILNATIKNTSFESHMTKYRSLSQSLYEYNTPKDKIVKKIFSLNEQQFSDKTKAQTDSRILKLKNLVSISAQAVMGYLENPPLRDVYDKIIYAQLNTGSRFVEILKDTKFVKSPDAKMSKDILIIGTAKTKDKNKELTRPLIVSNSKSMIALIAEIRKALPTDDMTNMETTAKYNSIVNTRLQSLTFIPEKYSSSHVLRKIYANMAYLMFAPSNMDRTVYIGDLLGHKEGSFGTSISYTNVKIVDDIIKTARTTNRYSDFVADVRMYEKKERKRVSARNDLLKFGSALFVSRYIRDFVL